MPVFYEATITHCLTIEEILDCMRTLLFTQARPKKGLKHELCFNIFFSFGKYLKANKFNGHQCFGDPSSSRPPTLSCDIVFSTLTCGVTSVVTVTKYQGFSFSRGWLLPF